MKTKRPVVRPLVPVLPSERGHLHITSRVLARNAWLNLMGHGLPLLAAVVAIPLIQRGLGPERFGILALAWMVLGYFSELGFGRATTKLAAEVVGRGQESRLAAITWVTIGIQMAFGIVGALVLALATPWLVGGLIKIPPALIPEARAGFYLLACMIPVVLISSSFRGVLEAAQRFDYVNAVRIPYSVGTFVLPLIGLLIGWKIPGIFALLLTSRLITAIAYYLLDVKVFPVLAGWPRADWRELKLLFGLGSWMTVSSVVSPMLVYLDRFVIGAVLTVAAVGYYSAPFELVTRLLIVPASIMSTLFPAFSTLHGRGDWEHVERLVARAVKFVLFALGPVVLVLVAGAHDILTLWLGPEFARQGTVALQVLSVGVLINALAHVPYSMIQGLGRPDVTAKFHLIELPLQAVLVWLLVRQWGIPGAACAWSIRVALDAGLLFYAASKLSSVSLASYLAERVPQTALMMVLFGSIATIGSAELPLLWQRALLIATLVAAGALVGWHYSLGDGDRGHVLGAFRSAAAQ